jgi:hypothetical protein
MTGPGIDSALDIAELVSKSLALSVEIRFVVDADDAVLVIVLANVGLPDQELVVIGLGVPALDEEVSEAQLLSESLMIEWVAIMKSVGSATDGLPLNMTDLVCT